MTHWTLWMLAMALGGPALAQSSDEPGRGVRPPTEDEEVPDRGVRPPVADDDDDDEEEEARIAALEETVASQQAALADLQSSLAQTKLQLIPGDDVTLTFEGHYRIRGYVFNHLFANQRDVTGEYRDARYIRQRLWLRPKFSFRDAAHLYVEFRALDDILFGDNAALASTPLFAEAPSETGIDGQEQPSVRVARAWLETTLPVGLLRLGRQANDWGMGLLANNGEKWDHHFGESHYGSTADRLLFATRPIAIAQAITGAEDSDIPLFAAVAVDRLVEDPLDQYYGYKCSPGDTRGVDDDYDRRCDSDGDGVTDLDHSYVDDEYTANLRGNDWWADQGDDVWEMVYVLAYRGEDVKYLGGVGDLTAGAWVVHRKQLETDSNVVVIDGYLKALVHGILLESEVVGIQGRTRAIALPGSTNEGKSDPLRKRADIFGYVVRTGYRKPAWKVQFEHGFASGDERITDADFTGRALHPDHNVGLLLYEEVISRVTATSWTETGRGLWSRGGVYNSRYIFPTAHLFPVEDLEILAGFVNIWPDRPDGAIIQCSSRDKVECDTPASQQAEASTIGHEIDFGVKYTMHEHIKFSLEGGYARVTDRLPLEAVGLNKRGRFFTVQSRIAWVF